MSTHTSPPRSSRFRAWTWTRIDGRNVVAMPTRDEVHLYDSEDFIMLDKIAPSGHRSYIQSVRWSAFHGKLASLSATQLVVHAPQIVVEDGRERVRFVRICDFDLSGLLTGLHALSFSRCAELLLVGGPRGLSMLDIRATPQLHNGEDLRLSCLGDPEKKIVWSDDTEGADIVKFSPCSYVFAAFQKGATGIRVWRSVRDATSTHDLARRVIQVETLKHPEPVAYASWKPAATQMHAANEYDGARKARWFEPRRMLLTCTKSSRTIRIWIESETSHERVVFIPGLVFEPALPLRNVRWVLSKNRNISEEKFQIVDSSDEQQVDWLSGVDQSGVLHLYQLLGITSKSPRARDTELRIKVNGDEDGDDTLKDDNNDEQSAMAKLIALQEICVMAYFSQNYFGLPSKLDIVLQRSDGILLSYIFAIDKKKRVQAKKKTWYRRHLGSIAALAAHPSLPLIASVDEHRKKANDPNSPYGNEILIFWISFSAFSAESRLIPSGVVECSGENGQVLCVQWIPTLHFDATPLFLVAYESGVIDVYGRSANARDVVNSPRSSTKSTSPHHPRKLRQRSPSLSPWTFFDYSTGKSGMEYEVGIERKSDGLGFGVEVKDGVLRVSHCDQAQITSGDEVVAFNTENLAQMTASAFQEMVDSMPVGKVALLRFRAQNQDGQDAPRSSDLPAQEVDEMHKPENQSHEFAEVQKLSQGFLSSTESDFSLNTSYVHAGSVSMYGGWRQMLTAKVATSLQLVCVCPVYADDGEYVAGTVLIFAVAGVLPGRLSVWKGQFTGSGKHAYSIVPLHVNDNEILEKQNITSIAGERDYRQRAFTSTKQKSNKESLNSLVFVGDSSGCLHHWRCRVSGDCISFAMMSAYSLDLSTDKADSVEANAMAFKSHAFFRRGYFNSRRSCRDSIDESDKREGIQHIEVDDPNRIAVLHASCPDTLHVFEGESGLGMMRLEETITAEGRGRILGFCWCNAHVEFNIDALAVQYESAIVIYQYDMNTHQWSQVGKDVATTLATFDCTRDSSALLIGGGHVNSSGKVNEETEEIPVVLGKWDEPGNLLQDSMDWKAPESPQKLPVWHPYVIVTTLFGMHARVGVKDTTMASDTPVFEFSKAFRDAVQMLKLLARVLEDDASTQLSASTGVLTYSVPQTKRVGGKITLRSAAAAIMFMGHVGRRDMIGRYSTAIHTDASLNRAENLFADPVYRRGSTNGNGQTASNGLFGTASKSDMLETDEACTLTTAVDEVLQGKSKLNGSGKLSNASILFGSFQCEQLLELKAILQFVNVVQSLGFELDASAADLGAKRYFAMFLFGRSLQTVLDSHASIKKRNPTDEPVPDDVEQCAMDAFLREAPSSGLLWALHSSAQTFLIEHCVLPQPTWEELRPMWLGLWIREISDLRSIAERLAKTTYTRTRDAMNVALYYIALGKKNILCALAKMSKLETNKNLAIFLDNDFSQERWSNAAVKNAYSLLSKKQYETAAAFFLLCEPPRLQEALRLLAIRLQDPSLALLIARLVEHRMSDSFSHDFMYRGGSGLKKEMTPAGESTKRLLEGDLIPHFRERRDRWLESAALWWLEDFEQACTILLPQSQPIDVKLSGISQEDDVFVPDTLKGYGNRLGIKYRSRSVTFFFVNLTSIPIYFQFLHASEIDAPVVTWAIKKLLSTRSGSGDPSFTNSEANAAVSVAARRHKLASTAEIEHAYAFAAYVCKRCGMSDTSVIEMLQARHLVNLHAKVELRQQPKLVNGHNGSIRSPRHQQDDMEIGLPTSPRTVSYLQAQRKPHSPGTTNRLPSFSGDRFSPRRSASTRRMSELNDIMDSVGSSPMVQGMQTLQKRSSTMHWSLSSDNSSSSPSTASSPWLKAQIADIECRRWSSSAFVGKMLGIRVAREMITHFRAEFDACFLHFVEGAPLRAERHRDFLEELCAPLCEQFQVDRTYILEAALAVLQPHAYLHIAEICFLLSVLGRSTTLTKWIQYVALSTLKSCGTFASCRITEAIYRDWESLTIQLCYVLHLDAQDQIDMPYQVIAQVAVAVRTGCVFLGWCRQQWQVVHEAITRAFYSRVGEPRPNEDVNEFYADLSKFSFEQNLELIRILQRHRRTRINGDMRQQSEFTAAGDGFGFLFLRTIAAHLHGDDSSIFDGSSQPDGEIESRETEHSDQPPKLHKMYTLILMVSVLRTLYARGQVFLLSCSGAGKPGEVDLVNELEELDISSSLFTPRKLWKPQSESPLDGLRRWYSLIESHLRCEFDYSVREVTCICGLYGLDGRSVDLAARVQKRIVKFEESLALQEARKDKDHHHHHKHFVHFGFRHHAHVSGSNEGTDSKDIVPSLVQYELEEFLHAVGIAPSLHQLLLHTSDDYILLLMRHPKYGVPLSLRRFRLEPRVHVKCFLLKDAFYWFVTTTKIFATISDANRFLSRCCKQRKIRLLVKHRGQDAHQFPSHHHFRNSEDEVDGRGEGDDSMMSDDQKATPQSDEEIVRTLSYQAMMFVDPWEVEAEANVARYMHDMRIPLHIELGWDRLSPICTAVVDNIAKAVFHGDAELCEMWQSTRGEGWLITSIIQYQLDGVHSHRSGHVDTKCVFEEENKVPFLVEVHSRSQRNALFEEVGLPHRFVGVIKVKLIAGKDLIPVKWIDYFNDPYVFFTVSTSDQVDFNYDTWSIQTYRSRCGPGGTNPQWDHPQEDEFTFRFAIPTHQSHFTPPGDRSLVSCDERCAETNGTSVPATNDYEAKTVSTAEQIWDSATAPSSEHTESVEVLESLFQHSFTGPPLYLHCAVYHKAKLLGHPCMGHGKVALTALASGHPIDTWIPLEDVESGSIHVQISLSFQLMCSSIHSGTGDAQSPNSYQPKPIYEYISDPSDPTKCHHTSFGGDSISSYRSDKTKSSLEVDADESLLVDQMPPLPPHVMPHVPRSTGSRF